MITNATIVTLARVICGTAIFITSMAMGKNGKAQTLAILLMGLPIEVLA